MGSGEKLKKCASGVNGNTIPTMTTSIIDSAQETFGLLRKNGTRTVRILNITSVWVAKDSKNPSPFKPGLSATVDIQTNRTLAMSVPIQSVTTRGKKDNDKSDDSMPKKDDDKTKKTSDVVKEYVFVYDAKTAKVKQVEVTTGIQNDTYIQVLSGLQGGEEVVSGPYSAISKTLNDKMDVEKVDKSKLFATDNSKK